MEKKYNHGLPEFILFLLCLSSITFIYGKHYSELQNEKTQQLIRENNLDAYQTGVSFIDSYVKLETTDAVALRSYGDIDFSDNYMMSRKYRYRSSSEKTNQRRDEYYDLSIYPLSQSNASPVTVDVLSLIPTHKNGRVYESIEINLREVNQTPYLVIEVTGERTPEEKYVYEVKGENDIRESQLDLTISDDVTSRWSWTDDYSETYLKRAISDLEAMGNCCFDGFYSNLESTTSTLGVVAYSGQDFEIYQNEELVELAKSGAYQLVLSSSLFTNKESAQHFLNLFKGSDQASIFDGLIMNNENIATADGQNHSLRTFEDYSRWKSPEYQLTVEAFLKRPDVQAILNDPTSTLLPLGVDVSDDSLVTYDLAKGALPYLVSDTNSYIDLYSAVNQINKGRSGFGNYSRVAYAPYYDLLVKEIDDKTAREKKIYYLESYGQMKHPSNPSMSYPESTVVSWSKIINEGSKAGCYAIFQVEQTYVDKGEYSLTSKEEANAYLMNAPTATIDKNVYAITSDETITAYEIANSLTFVQDGQAKTVKIPLGRRENN